MKILIAADKFKGTLNANEVCQAIAQGLRSNFSKSSIQIQALADGGDGTLALLQESLGMSKVTVNAQDPIGRSITANYLRNESTAFVELAEASGMIHLEPSQFDILNCSTLGTGELILEAYQNGCKNIILGLGGSCTNDVGIGIAHAIGFRFLDADKKVLEPIAKNIGLIESIEDTEIMRDLTFSILCDVSNPLIGKNGAAQVFGPQKGADTTIIKRLDNDLKKFAALISNQYNRNILKLKGGGAAGGIGAGLWGLFPKVELINGFEFLAKLINLKEKLENADLIITGEGRLDHSSLEGKVIGNLSKMCKHLKKPLIVVCGKNNLLEKEERLMKFECIYSLLESAPSLEAAIQNPKKYLREIGSTIAMKYQSQ